MQSFILQKVVTKTLLCLYYRCSLSDCLATSTQLFYFCSSNNVDFFSNLLLVYCIINNKLILPLKHAAHIYPTKNLISSKSFTYFLLINLAKCFSRLNRCEVLKNKTYTQSAIQKLTPFLSYFLCFPIRPSLFLLFL